MGPPVEERNDSQSSDFLKSETTVHHVTDPFAAVEANNKDHINYRSMGWVKAGALIMAEVTIALGILSFPSVFHRLGMFGGIFTTIVLAVISWQTGYVLVQFKINHPGVMNFADAGRVAAGKWGFWLFGGMLMTKSVFIAGSHALSGSIALNNISDHAICNIAWAAITAILSFLLTIPRTFEKVSYISFVSVTCILIACLITIITTGVQNADNLPNFPSKGPVKWYAFENSGLLDTVNAVTNIIFAYGGHVAIFSFAAEMREPADFKYSLGLVQVIATIVYVIVGATIYSFGGQYVTSPSLTMTSRPVRITAYAIALISIVISGVVASYVGAKFIFMTLFRGSDRLTSSSRSTWAAWILICACIWTVGWLIAELIPFFSDLLSIISSILTVWFTYGLSGVLWLYDHSASGPKGTKSGGSGFFGSWKACSGFLMSVFVIFFSAVIMVLGVYSAVTSIINNYAAGDYSHPFAC
ncbi:transmembrane amino acid transporter protein-domain-containing protein [Vararia minispora EC-137]|uniref:Transmembrane amino acid transporter protein-domain-containing protein n=1 Tax=Vararia minispora EC-137 TaxID=1314806 RepID=A0ACB8QIF9_9AGAM|nr:transmembrane amino acid transporter protein-domain-containing protein [Vararia minispora EC-137]